MFRLGTRPESMRTSWPLVLSTSSSSAGSTLIELGTCCAFSTRRSAVTLIVCN